MKLHPEDPRLTAYVLGELGPEDAASVESAAATDPAIQAEIEQIRAMQQVLTGQLAPPAEKLLPRQRENVRRAAREAEQAGKIISLTTLKTWLIPASAAAVLALATFILIRKPGGAPDPVASTPPVQAPPAPTAPFIIPPEAPVLAPTIPHGEVAAATSPMLHLPVLTGKSSLETVSNFIRTDEKFPPPESVRLEEILNNFPLRLNGVTAISRSAASKWHPDTRDTGMTAHVATLSTEMIPCPWKPSATLLLISLRGNAQADCDVKLAFHADPANVLRYRLLGFKPTDSPAGGKLPSLLKANSVTTLAIEIEPSQPGASLGSLAWSTDDQPAPAISLVHKPSAEPSDDARFAALVCIYSQWLAGELAGIIDADIVSALARESASTTLPADRADFLSLIDRSLHLPPRDR